MFDKAKMMAQAIRLKRAIESEIITFEENGVLIKVSGDQKVRELVVNGQVNKVLVEVINKALKKSQEAAARKMKEMGVGLEGLMG